MGNTEETRIISLCTGYGGIELGLHRVIKNLRTVCYVEVETFAITNLVAKIEQGKMDAAPIWSDIKTFPAKIFRGKVHGIVGGYPCQPFSAAGKRKGTADPRHLWPYIEQHIRTIRPVWCFFENVSGHLTLGFKEVFSSLRDMGYKVEAELFTAAEVGAPHKRERLFILAVASGTRAGNFNRQNRGRSRSSVLRQGNRSSGTGGASTAGELGNSSQIRLEGQRPKRREQVEPDRTGEQLANTRSVHTERPDTNGINGAGVCQRTRGSKVWGEDSGCCESNGELGNTERVRLQGQDREELDTEKVGTGCNQSWPARPRQEQHDWEEPRTVKPGMGRTVDGFRSRVDELRSLGNGVVPAQAELAFRTLIEKIE